MAHNVKLIRMLTGEDIIAEVISDAINSQKILIKNPVRVMLIPNKSTPQTPTVGFAPWFEFTEDKNFELDMTHVLCIMTPLKEFVNQYNATFSGIITPKTSGLILPG